MAPGGHTVLYLTIVFCFLDRLKIYLTIMFEAAFSAIEFLPSNQSTCPNKLKH